MFRRRDTEDQDSAVQNPFAQGLVNSNDDASANSAEAALPDASMTLPPVAKMTLADHLAQQGSKDAAKDARFFPKQTVPSSLPTASSSSSHSKPVRKPEPAKMFEAVKPQPSNDFSSSFASPVAASAEGSTKRTLTVGLETFLKGEISNCDRVVIEGGVDATMGDVQSLIIASTGSFNGSATVENAEISGVFDGDLVVHNRLLVHSTGKVTGKISYGEVEIKRGGKIIGQVNSNADAAAGNSYSSSKAAARSSSLTGSNSYSSPLSSLTSPATAAAPASTNSTTSSSGIASYEPRPPVAVI